MQCHEAKNQPPDVCWKKFHGVSKAPTSYQGLLRGRTEEVSVSLGSTRPGRNHTTHWGVGRTGHPMPRAARPHPGPDEGLLRPWLCVPLEGRGGSEDCHPTVRSDKPGVPGAGGGLHRACTHQPHRPKTSRSNKSFACRGAKAQKFRSLSLTLTF